MPARLMSLGRTGLVLLVANEIRGALVVAAVLAGSGEAGLRWQRLEAREARAACSLAPALCKSSDLGATLRTSRATG